MKKLLVLCLVLIPLSQSLVLAQVKVIKAPATYEFRDMGYDAVKGEVGIVGYEVSGATKTAKVFELNATRDGFVAKALVGLGNPTYVYGISSDSSRIAGASKSVGSIGAGEGTTWLRSAPSSPVGIGYVSGFINTSSAVGAWKDGVVGECGGLSGACKWTTTTSVVALPGTQGGLAQAGDVTSNGAIQTGSASHEVFNGAAYYWDNAGIHRLTDTIYAEPPAASCHSDSAAEQHCRRCR